jgi:hypothetical protein
MKTFILLVIGAAILVLGLIVWHLRLLAKRHPNAEMLARFYQMITSRV